MIKPSFFVLGAQKAGTTTLHEWLSSQGTVSLPKKKETHFFSREERYQDGWNTYLLHFEKKKGAVVSGEIDPDYLFFPEAIERIKVHINNPSFIIIFRNPEERALSQYKMSVRRGIENLTFEEALAAEGGRLESGERYNLNHFSYLKRSLYFPQVKRYITAFPQSGYLFLKFDDLTNEKYEKDTFKKICKFIGIEPDISVVDFNKVSNAASTTKFSFIRNLLFKKDSFLKTLLRPIVRTVLSPKISSRLIQKVDAWNRKPATISEKAVASELSKDCKDKINDDLKKLSTITGLSFDEWTYKD